MKTAIVDRADFVYLADLQAVDSPPGLFQLTLSTLWRQAREPEAEHVKASILLDAEGLVRLRNLIDATIALKTNPS